MRSTLDHAGGGPVPSAARPQASGHPRHHQNDHRKQQGSPQSGVSGCVPPSIRGLRARAALNPGFAGGRPGPGGAGSRTADPLKPGFGVGRPGPGPVPGGVWGSPAGVWGSPGREARLTPGPVVAGSQDAGMCRPAALAPRPGSAQRGRACASGSPRDGPGAARDIVLRRFSGDDGDRERILADPDRFTWRSFRDVDRRNCIAGRTWR